MMFGNMMYLRPGNLWKNFRVLKMHSDNVDGYMKIPTKIPGMLWMEFLHRQLLTKKN